MYCILSQSFANICEVNTEKLSKCLNVPMRSQDSKLSEDLTPRLPPIVHTLVPGVAPPSYLSSSWFLGHILLGSGHFRSHLDLDVG